MWVNEWLPKLGSEPSQDPETSIVPNIWSPSSLWVIIILDSIWQNLSFSPPQIFICKTLAITKLSFSQKVSFEIFMNSHVCKVLRYNIVYVYIYSLIKPPYDAMRVRQALPVPFLWVNKQVWRTGGVSPTVLLLINGKARSQPHVCQSLMHFLFIQQVLNLESYLASRGCWEKFIFHAFF